VERAIQATAGSPGGMARARQVTMTASGTWHNINTGMVSAATKEDTYRLPGFFRMSVELKSPGQPSLLVSLGLQEDQGWQSQGGIVQDMDRITLNTARNELHAYWVASLPLGNARLSWEKAPDATVDGKPTDVVTVKDPRRPDVQLFFDKQTGLLAKFAFQSPEPGQAVPKEFLLSNYRDFGGIKLPTKRIDTQSGKTTGEWTITEYKFHDRLDEKVFAKP
jgi:hypothetical protein